MTGVPSIPVSSKPKKAYKGVAMEGLIATWYANNVRGDQDYANTASRLVKKLQPGNAVLEVASGPGYLSIEIAKRGQFQMFGLDISKKFIEIAQNNARQAGVAIAFRLGEAAHLPFEDAKFDFIVCRAAFKNFTDPVGAIAEMWRVLKPGGKALIIDLRRDVSTETIDHYVRSMRMNPLNAFMTKWTFANFLTKSAHTLDELKAFVAQTNFQKYNIESDTMGFELWLEK